MKRLLLTIFSVALVLMPGHVNAAAIAPSVIEVSAARGEVVNQVIQVINVGATEQKYYLGVMKFEPKDDTGTPRFLSYEDDHDGLPLWINFPVKQVTVPANTKVDVPFQIVLPDDIASGGYYGAVTVSQAPSEVVATNGAVVEAKTASLVLLTVEGETVEKAALLDFSTEVGAATLAYEYRIQNQGNVHVLPEGMVQVKNLLGMTAFDADANSGNGRVLPSSTRHYKGGAGEQGGYLERAMWQIRHLAVGPMSAELSLTYGNSEELMAETSGWFPMPWEGISAMITGAIVLILMGRGLRKR